MNFICNWKLIAETANMQRETSTMYIFHAL